MAARRRKRTRPRSSIYRSSRGGSARYQGRAFGDRATPQVRHGDRDQVTGPVEELDPGPAARRGGPTAGIKLSPLLASLVARRREGRRT